MGLRGALRTRSSFPPLVACYLQHLSGLGSQQLNLDLSKVSKFWEIARANREDPRYLSAAFGRSSLSSTLEDIAPHRTFDSRPYPTWSKQVLPLALPSEKSSSSRVSVPVGLALLVDFCIVILWINPPFAAITIGTVFRRRTNSMS